MTILKNYIYSIGFIIAILLLMYLINPFNRGFLFGYPLMAIILIKKQFIQQNLDIDFTILLFLSIAYASFFAFDPISGNQYIFIYASFPPGFYLLGKYLITNYRSPDIMFYLFFTVGAIFSFSAMVSVLINYLQGGFAQLDRSLPMFWNGEIISATIMAAYFTLNMCIPALLIADQGRLTLIHKIIATAIFILSLVCVIRLGSRTQLGVMLITSLVSLLYVIPKQSFKKNVLLAASLLAVAYLIYRNISFDLNADWLSTFAGRMEKGGGDISSGGGRTERWEKSVQYIFEKPLGWSLGEFGQSHNLWLDVMRVSGIIPFILLLVFSVRSFFTIKNTIRRNRGYINLNVIILVHSIAFFLIFMVEPVFEGMFSLFVLFCMFMGIINKYRTMQPVNP